MLWARPNPALAIVVRSTVQYDFQLPVHIPPHASSVIMMRLKSSRGSRGSASQLKHVKKGVPSRLISDSIGVTSRRRQWVPVGRSILPSHSLFCSLSLSLSLSLNFISISSQQNHCGFVHYFRVPSNLKGTIVRNANQILTLATAPPCFPSKAAGQ